MKIKLLLGLGLLLTSCMSVKKLESSRNRAISYIEEAPYEINIVMIYNYLQQTNDLPDLKSQSAFDDQITYFKNSTDFNDSVNYSIIQQFWRLKDPNYKLPEQLLKSASGIDSLTLLALYCDQYAIDSTSHFSRLKKAGESKDSETNIALLTLAFLKNNNCYSLDELRSLNDYLDVQSAAILNEPELEWNDKSIETAAFRSEAKLDYQKAWLKEFLKAQQEDGGWKGRASNDASNSHTTIMAIWFLQNVINDLEK
ncbi:MAG: hypothetical protein ACO2Z9_02085 [Crocinitomicaceae bacterium]